MKTDLCQVTLREKKKLPNSLALIHVAHIYYQKKRLDEISVITEEMPARRSARVRKTRVLFNSSNTVSASKHHINTARALGSKYNSGICSHIITQIPSVTKSMEVICTEMSAAETKN